jgi:hypothetical protein
MVYVVVCSGMRFVQVLVCKVVLEQDELTKVGLNDGEGELYAIGEGQSVTSVGRAPEAMSEISPGPGNTPSLPSELPYEGIPDTCETIGPPGKLIKVKVVVRAPMIAVEMIGIGEAVSSSMLEMAGGFGMDGGRYVEDLDSSPPYALRLGKSCAPPSGAELNGGTVGMPLVMMGEFGVKSTVWTTGVGFPSGPTTKLVMDVVMGLLA